MLRWGTRMEGLIRMPLLAKRGRRMSTLMRSMPWINAAYKVNYRILKVITRENNIVWYFIHPKPTGKPFMPVAMLTHKGHLAINLWNIPKGKLASVLYRCSPVHAWTYARKTRFSYTSASPMYADYAARGWTKCKDHFQYPMGACVAIPKIEHVGGKVVYTEPQIVVFKKNMVPTLGVQRYVEYARRGSKPKPKGRHHLGLETLIGQFRFLNNLGHLMQDDVLLKMTTPQGRRMTYSVWNSEPLPRLRYYARSTMVNHAYPHLKILIPKLTKRSLSEALLELIRKVRSPQHKFGGMSEGTTYVDPIVEKLSRTIEGFKLESEA